MSGIPSWARVGAKVVCFTHMRSPGRRFHTPPPPIGKPVQIMGIIPDVNRPGEFSLIIKGYPNRNLLGAGEIGWWIGRFRPLVSQEDDIATHFRHHLDQRTPERERA